MIESTPRNSRVSHWAEVRERVMLVLAFLTIGLYLLHLRDWIDPKHPIYWRMQMAVDLIFVIDLLWKISTQGRAYLRTSWFLIDLLSCLPAVQWLGSGIYQLPGFQYMRAFRLFRVLRTLRVLRLLQTVPAIDRMFQEDKSGAMARSLHRSIRIGVLSTTLTVGTILIFVRYSEEQEFRALIQDRLAGEVSIEKVHALGGSLSPSPSGLDIKIQAKVDGQVRSVYFDSDPVIAEANEIEFFLVVTMLAGILIVMILSGMHLQSISREHMRSLLNLALPKQVATHFVDDPIAYKQKARTPATILFTDFVGFTATCESMAHQPDQLSMHLEQAMDQIVVALLEQDVIIDKFIGDAVMAFRGGPFVDGDAAEHAYRVVRGAINGARALAELGDPYFHQMKIGIASAPDCLIGAFGTSARLSYTALGDGVNLAARLEPASGQCATSNLCCEETHALCAGRDGLAWRRWGRIRVKGKSQPMSVYEVFDAKAFDDPLFLDEFHQALDAFERGEIQEARNHFANADELRHGGDLPSRTYVAWCDELLQVGIPEGWEAILPTRK